MRLGRLTGQRNAVGAGPACHPSTSNQTHGNDSMKIFPTSQPNTACLKTTATARPRCALMVYRWCQTDMGFVWFCRMLRAITPINPILATSIRRQDDFAKLTPYDVLERIQDLNNQSSSSKKKCVTPKARKEAKESSNEEECEDQQEDDDMELFSKRLNEICKRLGKSKERDSKRTCYECGEIGHFMFNWPCLVRRLHSRVPSTHVSREKNLACM